MSHSHFNYLKDGKVETIANEDLDTTNYCAARVKPESCLQNWVGSKTETLSADPTQDQKFGAPEDR